MCVRTHSSHTLTVMVLQRNAEASCACAAYWSSFLHLVSFHMLWRLTPLSVTLTTITVRTNCSLDYLASVKKIEVLTSCIEYSCGMVSQGPRRLRWVLWGHFLDLPSLVLLRFCHFFLLLPRITPAIFYLLILSFGCCVVVAGKVTESTAQEPDFLLSDLTPSFFNNFIISLAPDSWP